MDEESTNSRSTERGPGARTKPKGNATDGGWTYETQAQYDPEESRDLTTVIIKAVAEAEGVSMTEILSPTLYDVVDVAAIEKALFGRPDVSENGTESAVEFRYNEYKVSVEADGWVTVSKRTDEATAD